MGIVVVIQWSRGKVHSVSELINEACCDAIRVEEGSSASRIKHRCESEVSISKGEQVTEECNAFAKSKDRLRYVSVLCEKFGMDSNVSDYFKSQ